MCGKDSWLYIQILIYLFLPNNRPWVFSRVCYSTGSISPASLEARWDQVSNFLPVRYSGCGMYQWWIKDSDKYFGTSPTEIWSLCPLPWISSGSEAAFYLLCCKKLKLHAEATHRYSALEFQLSSQLIASVTCQTCEWTILYVQPAEPSDDTTSPDCSRLQVRSDQSIHRITITLRERMINLSHYVLI